MLFIYSFLLSSWQKSSQDRKIYSYLLIWINLCLASGGTLTMSIICSSWIGLMAGWKSWKKIKSARNDWKRMFCSFFDLICRVIVNRNIFYIAKCAYKYRLYSIHIRLWRSNIWLDDKYKVMFYSKTSSNRLRHFFISQVYSANI